MRNLNYSHPFSSVSQVSLEFKMHPFLFIICGHILYVILCIIICLKACEWNEKLAIYNFLPFYPSTSLFEGVSFTIIVDLLLVNVSKQPLQSIE